MLHQVGNFVTIPRRIPGTSKDSITWPAKVVDVCTSSSSRSHYKLRYADTDCAVREVDRVVSFEYADKHMKAFPEEGHMMRIVTQSALDGRLGACASHSTWGRDFIRACLRALREKVDARARSKAMRETCKEMQKVLYEKLHATNEGVVTVFLNFFDDSSDFVAHVHDHCESCEDDACAYPLCKSYKMYASMLYMEQRVRKNDDIKGKLTL